ncbi:hypothetical protein BCR44DRAFT_1173259 [Catenaria anguillulae PL171]|uniref:Uncharacterized protein n=1 Tax=Catenaria anguillulae PL171 TaxID=765915 RepID=A0A1Y2I0I6_9FUNG|nr:hypothetical protein BCR44DRAFT_1173259 [Catenaria anguillulae PL171]
MVADLLRHHNTDVSRESLESLLQSVRSLMLTCSHCFASAKPGFFQALDIHTQLAALPYLDLVGRLKLSLRLLHVLLTIPITINTAAGGNALPGWCVSTLHAMLGMLDTASTASGKVASVASKLGPQAARDALRSVLVAGPLKRASDGIRYGLGSIVSWRPWHVVWGPGASSVATGSVQEPADKPTSTSNPNQKQMVAAV